MSAVTWNVNLYSFFPYKPGMKTLPPPYVFWVKGAMHVECLAECLAQCKHSVNVS